MYISAMDTASAVNDSHQSSQLQRDIQKLVDLMERVGAGEEIMESQVPPPLAITPQIDVLPNALGELSARLADYHKALYFAEEELSDDRINKIQGMQRALQAIHNLQKRAEAGFPIRADEVPPPVAIPNDDEFDNDAIKTISRRLTQYQEALRSAEQSEGTDRRRITKIQSTLRTLEFLMTRAKAKRPVWKKDIPPEFEYCIVSPKGSPSMTKTKYLLVIRSLILRLSAPTILDSDIAVNSAAALKKLKALEEELVKEKDAQPWLRSGNSLPELTKEVEKLEKLAAKKKENISEASRNLTLLEVRIREYTSAALKAKKENQMPAAIKHFKVLKGLQALRESLEKGDTVDMTLVPPAPKDYTPTNESLPPMQANEESHAESRERISHGETARLLPVNFRPPPETAEDKLAQKLTNYLDPGDDFALESPASQAGQQNVIVNNMSKSTRSLLKKVQNSTVKLPAERVLYGDPGYSDASMNEEAGHKKEDMRPQNFDVDQALNESEGEKKVIAGDKVERETTIKENIAVADVNRITDLPEKSDATFEENHKPKEEEAVHHLNPKVENGAKIAAAVQSTPKSNAKSSGDIYSRKTLDSVGFLSCQTVPDKEKNGVTKEVARKEQCNDWNLPGATRIENPVSNNNEQTDQNSNYVPELSSDYSQASTSAYSNISENKPVSENAQLQDNQQSDEKTCENQIKLGGAADVDSENDVIEHDRDVGPAKSLESEKPVESTKTLEESLSNGHDSGIPSISMQNGNSSCLSQTSQTNNEGMSAQMYLPDSGHEALVTDSVADPSTFKESVVVKEVQLEEQPTSISLVQGTTSIGNSQQQIQNTSTQEDDNLTAKSIPISCSSDEFEFQDLMASMSVSPVLSKTAKQTSKEVQNQVNSISVSMSSIPKEGSLNVSHPKLSGPIPVDGSNTNSSALSSVNSSDGHIFSSSHDNNSLPTSLMKINHSSEQHFLSLPLSSGFMADSFSGKNLIAGGTQHHLRSQTNVVFTCLENLKYDLLVEKSKNQHGNSEEIMNLEARMNQIRSKLRQSGRLIWELYKACVESELTSIIKEIAALRDAPEDDHFIALQHKQKLANRELKLLQERLPKLSY